MEHNAPATMGLIIAVAVAQEAIVAEVSREAVVDSEVAVAAKGGGVTPGANVPAIGQLLGKITDMPQR